jgi:prepilin-type N-terminal cleavage/methylation domain-containing protein
MNNLKNKFKKLRGMTLIEIAIVLVIMGLLAGLTVPLLSELSKHRHYTSTQKYMDEIKQALAGYAGMHWRLPYADTNGDGIEDTGQLSGYLPFITLGIEAVDAWRNRYYYDVNSRLVTTTTQGTFCTALQNIGSTEKPQVAFSSGGATIVQAIVVLSSGENCALNGGNTPFPGDRDYESYTPTDTFDDIVVTLNTNYLYGKLNCSSTATSSCPTYTVNNRSSGNIWVRGGSYAVCTRIQNNSTFLINAGETILIYSDSGCSSLTSVITFDQASGADTNGDCAIRWTGATLIDE